MKKKPIPVGRPSVLRHTNAHGILKLLRESGSCSRADLVRASGLSAPTVTNVVKDLLSADLVEPLGEGQSSGGRPPDMLRFKAERGCLLGGGDYCAEHFFSPDRSERQRTGAAGGFACQAKNDSGGDLLLDRRRAEGFACGGKRRARDRLLALVVGVPAITNVDEGSVLSISTLEGWRSVPLRAMLSKIAGCIVIVENDTNLAAQGEHYCGAAQSVKDFVFINIGTNVGAGIFLGGRIHHGSQWSAGEIAYLRLPSTSRRQPTIHEFGELETVVTGPGIVKSWREACGKTAQKTDINAVEILNLALERRAMRCQDRSPAFGDRRGHHRKPVTDFESRAHRFGRRDRQPSRR